jgi:hypothetical protein
MRIDPRLWDAEKALGSAEAMEREVRPGRFPEGKGRGMNFLLLGEVVVSCQLLVVSCQLPVGGGRVGVDLGNRRR